MSELRYTLLSDGSSDQALMPLLEWLLRQQGIKRELLGRWADLGRLRKPPTRLADRIRQSIELYPCEILFVHRDAEGEPRRVRVDEIMSARNAAGSVVRIPPIVCVVPVRMTEAWLLFDEKSLRSAAANPRGRQTLSLPSTAALERDLDPKARLQGLLQTASGRHGRRLQQFQVAEAVQRLANLIDDFAPLRVLPAFSALEDELASVVSDNGWERDA